MRPRPFIGFLFLCDDSVEDQLFVGFRFIAGIYVSPRTFVFISRSHIPFITRIERDIM